MKVTVSDETERQFREAAMVRFGYMKGSLSTAAERAFAEWARENELQEIRNMAREEGITDPVQTIKGMLKHAKQTAVELKHEAAKIRAARYNRVSRRRKRLP